MPYRDEKEALRAKLEELETAVQSIEARARELDHLRQDESALRRQRDELRNKLRMLEGGRKLPMLDDVRVASPCSESWSDMVGDDTARFCLKCEKNVYDLSSMTRPEAEALIEAKEGQLCVRFYRRADGTMLTADCPVGVTRRRRRRIAALTMLGAGLVSAVSFVRSTLCVQGDISPPTMGDIAEMGTAAPQPVTPPAPPSAAPPTSVTGHVTMGVVAPRPPPSVHPEPKLAKAAP